MFVTIYPNFLFSLAIISRFGRLFFFLTIYIKVASLRPFFFNISVSIMSIDQIDDTFTFLLRLLLCLQGFFRYCFYLSSKFSSLDFLPELSFLQSFNFDKFFLRISSVLCVFLFFSYFYSRIIIQILAFRN